ncbi:hypothetical protein RJ640_001878 [Escallonia rubra]|uniref:Ribose-5-phosphate isomerase n=1 Tax=Escallonia rubra TaxID=112253 RepID=A0AA88S3E1_9ASTE|nr:hypothetical protein RJ640_001878 [Escallonia rubra]
MVLGLGTGSTDAFVVAKLGALLKSGELTNIVGVPTSKQTQEQATSLNIPLFQMAPVIHDLLVHYKNAEYYIGNVDPERYSYCNLLRDVYETEDVIDVYVTGVEAVPQMVVNPSTVDPPIVNLPTGDPPNVETLNVESEESISIDEEYNEEEPVRSDPDVFDDMPDYKSSDDCELQFSTESSIEGEAGGGMSHAVGERATFGEGATVGFSGEGATVGGVGEGATVGGDGVHGESTASRGRGRGLTRGRGRSPARSRGRGRSPARSRGRGGTVVNEGAGGDGVHRAGSVNDGAASGGRGRAPARGRGRGATVGKGAGGDGAHGAWSANDGAASRGRSRGLARGRGRAPARGRGRGDSVVGEGAGGDGVHGAGSVNDVASSRGKGRGFRVRGTGRGTGTLNAAGTSGVTTRSSSRVTVGPNAMHVDTNAKKATGRGT